MKPFHSVPVCLSPFCLFFSPLLSAVPSFPHPLSTFSFLPRCPCLPSSLFQSFQVFLHIRVCLPAFLTDSGSGQSWRCPWWASVIKTVTVQLNILTDDITVTSSACVSPCLTVKVTLLRMNSLQKHLGQTKNHYWGLSVAVHLCHYLYYFTSTLTSKAQFTKWHTQTFIIPWDKITYINCFGSLCLAGTAHLRLWLVAFILYTWLKLLLTKRLVWNYSSQAIDQVCCTDANHQHQKTTEHKASE